MAHDVFISYSTKDKTIADAVCAKLEERKIRCWIAPRDIAAGQNFARSIIQAIDSSKVFVLIWSLNTNASEHILNEINQAFDRGIPIIPFRIQDVQPTSEMRYYFGRTHWLDALSPPLEKHIDTLASNIYTILGKEPFEIPEPTLVMNAPAKETDKSQVEPVPDQKFVDKKKESIQSPEKQSPLKQKTSSKKNFSKKNIFIPVSLGVLLVTTLALMYAFGLFTGILPAENNQAPSSTAPLSTDSFSETPVEISPTSNLPAWVTDFAEPILLEVAKHPSNFEDDFSGGEGIISDWGTDPGVSLSDGVMHLSAINGAADAWVGIPSVVNFVLDFKFTPKISTPGGNFGFHFRVDDNGDFALEFSSDGSWRIFSWGPEGASAGIASGQDNRITINNDIGVILITKGDEIALYLFNEPVGYGQTETHRTGNGAKFNILSPQGSTEVEIDDVRIWDLDNLIP